MSLDDRVVLITGGARRLGRTIAEGLAARGARLAIHYRSSAREAEEVAARLNAKDNNTHIFQADLADARAAQDLPGRVADVMGTLDVLINSAAIMLRQPFAEVTPDTWDRTSHLNVRAYFFTAQGAAPFLRQSHGAIINISDVAAFDPWPDYLPHCVSKAGVEMLTKGLARVLAPEVRVNGIAPGAVLLPDEWTDEERSRMAERTPLKRLGTPESVLQAVQFLLDTDYVTGSTVVVDGGQLVRPRVSF